MSEPKLLQRRVVLLSVVSATALVACGGAEDLSDATSDGADDEKALADADASALDSAGSAQEKTAVVPLLDSFKEWQLELPIDSQGGVTNDPWVIGWPFTSKPPQPALGDHLTVSEDKKVVTVSASPFGAVKRKANGESTAGGARCEFKQIAAQRWNPFTANRSLSLTLQPLRLPQASSSKDEGVMHIAQVHDGAENLIMVSARTRLGGKGGDQESARITVTFNHHKEVRVFKVLDTEYRIGDILVIKLICRKGKGTVTYRNPRSKVTLSFTETLHPLSQVAYFKVGVYPQTDGALRQTASARSSILTMKLGN